MKKLVIFSLWLVKSISAVEFFSSMAHMKQLNLHERELIEKLEDYIKNQEGLLQKNKEFVADIKRTRPKNSEIVSHPNAQYKLIKRMHNTWENMIKFNKDNNYVDDLFLTGKVENLKANENIPTKPDLLGAGQAIIRLQQTYDLSASDFADGKIDFSRRLRTPPPIGSFGHVKSVENHFFTGIWP